MKKEKNDSGLFGVAAFIATLLSATCFALGYTTENSVQRVTNDLAVVGGVILLFVAVFMMAAYQAEK